MADTSIILSGTTTVSSPTATTYIVLASGALDVASGGAVSGATAIGPTGVITVEAGGNATSTTLTGGGTQFVYGNAVNTVISAGGIQHVYFGGVATGSNVAAGGFQNVYYATANGSVLLGDQQVGTGGVTNGTVVLNGGREYVFGGGVTNGTIVMTGGMQYIDTGSTSNTTAVNGGGFQYVVGTANDSNVASGGQQQITGISNNAHIASGGVQQVLQGGTATATTIDAGGLHFVNAGATANATIINGGFQYVGGTVNGTTINSGEMGVAGIANATHLAGGVEVVYDIGVQNGVDFAGSAATLVLAKGSGLTGTVSNFELGDVIDLAGTSVSSFEFDGTTLSLVTDHGNFAYQFANVEAGTEFTVASDGHGGSAIGLALLSQMSASLVPEAGLDAGLVTQDPAANTPALHAQAA